MKTKLILMITCLLAGLSGCKKDSSGGVNASIVGKWAVTKQVISMENFTVAGIKDTTYTGSAFNSSDYFQFNRDNTAMVSESGIFSVFGKSTATDGTGKPIYGINKFKYSVAGQELTLTSTLILPMPLGVLPGPFTEEITKLDAQNLQLHKVETNNAYKITTDTYYKRME